VTNSALLGRVPGLHPDNLVRDVGLQIDRLPGSDTFWLSPCGSLFEPRKRWAAEIPLTPLQVFRYVEECRKQWQDEIIDAMSSESVYVTAGEGDAPHGSHIGNITNIKIYMQPSCYRPAELRQGAALSQRA
jgi:hypothetical protein